MAVATASTAILGGADDNHYLREAVQVLDDGSVQVTLKCAAPMRRRRQGMPTVRPEADVVVLSGTRTSRALGQYRFRLANGGGVHDVSVQVPGPSDVAGVLAGLAKVLHRHRDGMVAIKAEGLLHVAELLADNVKPRLVLMHDAVAKLTACWSWTVQNRFVIGVPVHSDEVSSGKNSYARTGGSRRACTLR
jgi:hypothetical protein